MRHIHPSASRVSFRLATRPHATGCAVAAGSSHNDAAAVRQATTAVLCCSGPHARSCAVTVTPRHSVLVPAAQEYRRVEALQQAAAGLRAAAQARSSRYNYSMPYNPDEYYAEEQFSASSVRAGRVYSGPLLFVGFSIIMGCFCMSTVTKKSPNLSFKWLQRRVGAQFGTAAYFLTTNVMYTHDGHHWRTRDFETIMKRMFGRAMLDYERWKHKNSS